MRNNEAYCTELHEFGGIRFAIPPYGPTTPGDCNDITQMAEFYLQRALSLLLSPDKEDAMEPFWKTGSEVPSDPRRLIAKPKVKAVLRKQRGRRIGFGGGCNRPAATSELAMRWRGADLAIALAGDRMRSEDGIDPSQITFAQPDG